MVIHLPAGAWTLTPTGPSIHPDTWHFGSLQPPNWCAPVSLNPAPLQQYHPFVSPGVTEHEVAGGASGAALSSQDGDFCSEGKAGRRGLCRSLPATKAGGRRDAYSPGWTSSALQSLKQGIIHTFTTHSNTAPAKARRTPASRTQILSECQGKY